MQPTASLDNGIVAELSVDVAPSTFNIGDIVRVHVNFKAQDAMPENVIGSPMNYVVYARSFEPQHQSRNIQIEKGKAHSASFELTAGDFEADIIRVLAYHWNSLLRMIELEVIRTNKGYIIDKQH